jgi:ketosteroid isomerase-like protein
MKILHSTFKAKPFAFLFLCGILISCHFNDESKVQDKTENKLSLLATDRSFSDLSEREGMKIAFIEYLDSNGVLLRPGQLPVIGAQAIDYLVQQSDFDYTMSWDPRSAEVAASGDLGVTYGIYIIKPKHYDTLIYGNYVSTWKKQLDGKWKLMLHSANEGLGQ